MHAGLYSSKDSSAEASLFLLKVQIHVHFHCESLPENTFKPIILDNYYNPHHF
ncbi:hypothetical protein T459_23047 [Capsicum annuum]|uniref:DCD domain-containing protein n=1 Tax=Capsicum annuum TaxID=4072 RepID=A0A2G2YR90_CAPAN|nr:hypothetical protein T459_23047 [Capsicum annuum]